MTNIAMALLKDPTIVYLIPTVYIMGGTYLGRGDTPNFMTEFNAYTDPEALYTCLNTLK